MPASIFLRESLYPQHLPTFRDDLGEKCGLEGECMLDHRKNVNEWKTDGNRFEVCLKCDMR